jgi:hypothetical protein
MRRQPHRQVSLPPLLEKFEERRGRGSLPYPLIPLAAALGTLPLEHSGNHRHATRLLPKTISFDPVPIQNMAEEKSPMGKRRSRPLPSKSPGIADLSS